MKNTLSDLNNYLFESIERLNDDELDEEQLDKEIRRSEAVQKIAKTIIDNGTLALHAKKYMDEYGIGTSVEIPLLGITDK
jgi:putative N-acetylmannosamine-6-phosphate epimerase